MLVVLGVLYEGMRSRPPEAEPLERGTPLRPDETSRMEGGVLLRFTRGSEAVLELNATSMAQLEGGAHFVRDVLELRAFMADGRYVSLSARSGTVRTSGQKRENVSVVLKGDVRVLDPEGFRLVTDELQYDTALRRLSGPGPARLSGPGLRSRIEAFEYRPDERVIETRGAVEADLGGDLPWRFDAARALYRLGPGEFVFPGAFRARQPDRSILGSAGVIRPARDDRPLQFEGSGPVVVTGPGPGVSWQLTAGSLAVIRPGTVPGSAEAGRGTSIAARSREGAGRGALGAPRWTIEPAADDDRTTIARAPDGFAARWTPARGQPWSATGAELIVRREPGRGVARLEARGKVGVSGGAGVRVLGERLSWSIETPEQVLVEGHGARAMKGQDLIEAPTIRYLRAERLLVGQGGAITEIATVSGPESGLFAGEEPVRVRSESVAVPLEGGTIEFRGPVQAWQFDTVLRASRMSWSEAGRELVAEGDVVGRFVVGRRTGAVRTLRTSARRLTYDAGGKTARLVGEARFEDADIRLQATTIDVALDAAGEVRRLDAHGGVVIERGDDVGRSDRLVWTGGRMGVIELLGEKRLARLLPAGQGKEVRASLIRYHLASRQYETEGGGGRSVITGKQREADGDGAP